MSITDELRLFAADPYTCWAPTDKQQADLQAIADRIDAEHERAAMSAMNDALYYANDESMAKLGWVRLPKDADGEPIHVGDVMEWIDLDGEVTVTCSVDAVGVDCFFAWDKGNRRYAQKCANAYRHHHAPTVEDVLREFARECLTYATCVDDHEVQDAIEMYAAKVREVLGE